MLAKAGRRRRGEEVVRKWNLGQQRRRDNGAVQETGPLQNPAPWRRRRSHKRRGRNQTTNENRQGGGTFVLTTKNLSATQHTKRQSATMMIWRRQDKGAGAETASGGMHLGIEPARAVERRASCCFCTQRSANCAANRGGSRQRGAARRGGETLCTCGRRRGGVMARPAGAIHHSSSSYPPDASTNTSAPFAPPPLAAPLPLPLPLPAPAPPSAPASS